MKPAKNPVGAVETTIELIEALESLDGATVTELADALGVTKGTAHNHLATLQQHHYVVKQGNTYTLSLKFLVIGEYLRNSSVLYENAKAEVEQLAADTGEYAHLSTEQHGLSQKLHKVRGEYAVGTEYQRAKLQKPDCLHYTATGKAILAYLPRSRVEEIIDYYGLPERTKQTITDRDELYETLADIRERGYALNDEEEVERMRAVGAPIRNKEGTVLGAVSVSGPVSRMKDEQFTDVIPEKVTDAATVIEMNINMAERRGNLPRYV
ncbi:IclR family transcriptional regulator [Halogranum rubrum]|uniref:ArcR family transcription regulator n=1 Tax=Halogranum salarium B-1 TaxID=1210908 RepID=J3JHA1_9EURY|nr:IclR family transcriptional regulator [Halogranum salarium]EJN60806.1 ArcR family transcription regulator [Halogranum salarium B-1]